MKKYIIAGILIIAVVAYYIVKRITTTIGSDVAAISADIKHPASGNIPMPPAGQENIVNKIEASAPSVASNSLPTGYVYVSNLNSTTVSVCPIMKDGSITTCGQSGNNLNAPSGLAITHDKRALYVTNQGSSEINVCMIDKMSGQLNNCVPTGNGFNAPSAVAISNNGQFVYVANENGNSISLCMHDKENKSLSQCNIILNDGLASPTDINFAPETNHVYIASSRSNNIIFCMVGPGKELIKCHPTGDGFSSPQSVSVTANDKFAYITNQSANSVSLCQVDAISGEFSNCQSTGSGFNAPSDLTYNAEDSRAYVSNASSIMRCNVSMDGTLTACTQFNGNFNHSTGIRMIGG